MSLINNLLGNSSMTLRDRDVSYEILKDSKFTISCVSKAAMETTNPQLRQLLSSQLTETLNKHFELSDLMIKKGWYDANDDPNQQLQKDILESPVKFKKDSD
ncbi:MAG: spore coat protein [Clostridiaceae bacterium]|nr:spore coat protein [Clostridiaceae bacterium]